MKMTKCFTTVITPKRNALLNTACLTFHSIIPSRYLYIHDFEFDQYKAATLYQWALKSYFW
jgi:hypothetical protein